MAVLSGKPYPFVYQLVLTALACLLTLTTAFGDDEVAEVQSEYSVPVPINNLFMGAASYKIPIEVTPGRNSLAPKLSFSYSSYEDNGWLGVGWTLDMGCIERSTRRGVDYSADEYVSSLNKAKEDLVSQGGTWGTDYYGAKLESNFTKYYKDPAGGWVVTKKDGTKYFYGTTTNSRQYDPADPDRVFRWLLEKVEDTNQNEMTISYQRVGNQLYLEEISYPGNNEVLFFLETTDRTDKIYSYRSNFEVTINRRLDYIEIWGNNQLARTYDLSYSWCSTSKRSILANITKKGNDGLQTLPIAELSYYSGSNATFDGEYNLSAIANNSFANKTVVGDFNGDAISDILCLKYNSSYFYAWMSDSNGSFNIESHSSSILGSNDWQYSRWGTGDFNGDGKSDLVQVRTWQTTGSSTYIIYHADLYIYLRNDSGSFDFPITFLGADSKVPGLYLVDDYNGDGLSDLAVIGLTHTPFFPDSEDHTYNVKLMLSNGDGTFNYVTTLGSSSEHGVYDVRPVLDAQGEYMTFPSCGSWFSGDVTGDGRADLINLNTLIDDGFNKIFIWQTQEGGTFEQTTTNEFDPVWLSWTDGDWSVSDINGDGISDLVQYLPYSGVNTWISDGTKLFDYIHQSDSSGPYDPAVIGDVNGDKMADVVRFDHNSNTYTTLQSDGDGTYTVQTQESYTGNPSSLYPNRMVKGDFNGDGMMDISIFDINFSYFTVLPTNQGQLPSLLHEATNAFDGMVTLDYTFSSRYENDLLPMVVPALSSLKLDDEVITAVPETTYLYKNGLYNYQDREFRGFGWVKQLNPDNSVKETWFHQDAFRKGRQEKEVLFATDGGTELIRSENDWEEILPEDSSWGFVKLNQSKTWIDGNSSLYSQRDYTYDIAGNLTEIYSTGWGAAPVTEEYTYYNYGSANDMLIRRTKESIRNDSGQIEREVEYRHDGNTGNLEEKEFYNNSGVNPIIHYEYDLDGNIIKEWDAEGNLTTTEYDSTTNTYPWIITNPLGHTETMTWNYQFGKIASEMDANGNVTEYDYDTFGRIEEIRYPDGGQVDTKYDDVQMPRQRLTKVLESYGSTVDTYDYYDGFARKVETITKGESGQSIVIKTQFDNMGRADKKSGPFYGSGTGSGQSIPVEHFYEETIFDARSRPLFVRTRDKVNGENITEYEYTGFVTKITDPDGCSKSELRDHLDRIIWVVEHAENDEDFVTLYEYNVAGDLIAVKNHLWQEDHDQYKIKFDYDTVGRKIYMKDPDLGQWTYTYDPNGNLLSQIDNNGQTIEFGWDELNRIKSKKHSGNPTTGLDATWMYDTALDNGVGRLHNMTTTTRDNLGNEFEVAESYGYDPMGRVWTQTKNFPAGTYTTDYEYDYSGKMVRQIYPGAGSFYVDYHYYPGSNLLHTVTGSNGIEYAMFTEYEPNETIGRMDHHNGAYTLYEYDPWALDLISVETYDSGLSLIQDKSYTFSGTKDIVQVIDGVKGATYNYQYDKLHRLIGETSTKDDYGYLEPVILEFDYDENSPINAATGIHRNGINFPNSYDANGNLINGYDLSGTTAIVRDISYNTNNMPVEINHGTGGITEFVYDGDDKRVKKQSPGETTYYVGDHFEVINGVETNYIFGGNLRIAKVSSDGTFYYHKDHLGSTTVMTNDVGVAQGPCSNLPYGGDREVSGVSRSNYRFTDQERDVSTGLYNYDARLYDPTVGQFISPDSIIPNVYEPQALNRFAYCLNNPLIYIDPSGHVSVTFSGTSMGIQVEGNVITTTSHTSMKINVVPDIVGANVQVTKDIDEGSKTNKHGLAKWCGFVTDKDGNIIGVYAGADIGVPGIEGKPMDQAIQALGNGVGKSVKALGDIIKSVVDFSSPEPESDNDNEKSESDNNDSRTDNDGNE